MKPKVYVALISVLAFALAGCHQATSTAALSAKQAAQLVMPLQASIGTAQSGIKLCPGILSAAADSSMGISGGARAVSPQNLTTTPNSSVSAFPLVNGVAITPAALYATGSGTGTKRFPASGYYSDVASVQTDKLYFFYLTPVSGSPTKFTVQLYDYPMADFSVYYVLENYVVDGANASSTTPGVWAWATENTAGTVGNENSITTYYLDGTNDGGSTVLATSGSSGPVVYSAFSPNINVYSTSSPNAFNDPTQAAAFPNYSFPTSFSNATLASSSTFNSAFGSFISSNPANAGAITNNLVTVPGTTWSSVTAINNAKLNQVSYYTEVAPTTNRSPYQYAYGLTFSTNESAAGSSFSRSVARYSIDFANKAQTYRALEVSGSKWGNGNSANSQISTILAIKSDLGLNPDGLINVNRSAQIWYPSDSTLGSVTSVPNTAPNTYQGLVLNQVSAGAFTYAGTEYMLWSGTGNTYAVSVSGNSITCTYSGSATTSQLAGTPALAANPRAAAASTVPSFLSASVTIPLASLGSPLTIPVNGGTFTGTFSGTQFTGTFTYGSSSVPVTITAGSVTAQGTTFTSSELLG